MTLQIGDRVLTKCEKGWRAIFSELIAWWLHSKHSHVMPVISTDGQILDITLPRPKITSLVEWFSGKYRVTILRPVAELTAAQQRKFIETAQQIQSRDYDLESFVSFLANSPTRDPRKINCAEGTLLCDQAAGMLVNCDGVLISPQSYDDFATAGMFMMIYSDSCPGPDDFIKLVKG